jgi:hypothetical protein
MDMVVVGMRAAANLFDVRLLTYNCPKIRSDVRLLTYNCPKIRSDKLWSSGFESAGFVTVIRVALRSTKTGLNNENSAFYFQHPV